jgi:hypothetical protein
MNLSEYIRQIGVERFSADLGVSQRAARSWLYGARKPRMEVVQRIVARTPVTLEGITGGLTQPTDLAE